MPCASPVLLPGPWRAVKPSNTVATALDEGLITLAPSRAAVFLLPQARENQLAKDVNDAHGAICRRLVQFDQKDCGGVFTQPAESMVDGYTDVIARPMCLAAIKCVCLHPCWAMHPRGAGIGMRLDAAQAGCHCMFLSQK